MVWFLFSLNFIVINTWKKIKQTNRTKIQISLPLLPKDRAEFTLENEFYPEPALDEALHEVNKVSNFQEEKAVSNLRKDLNFEIEEKNSIHVI